MTPFECTASMQSPSSSISRSSDSLARPPDSVQTSSERASGSQLHDHVGPTIVGFAEIEDADEAITAEPSGHPCFGYEPLPDLDVGAVVFSEHLDRDGCFQIGVAGGENRGETTDPDAGDHLDSAQTARARTGFVRQ